MEEEKKEGDETSPKPETAHEKPLAHKGILIHTDANSPGFELFCA